MQRSRDHASAQRQLHCSASASASTASARHVELVRQRALLQHAATATERRNADAPFRSAMDAFLSTTLDTLDTSAAQPHPGHGKGAPPAPGGPWRRSSTPRRTELR